jgi:hypothetical protein
MRHLLSWARLPLFGLATVNAWNTAAAMEPRFVRVDVRMVEAGRIGSVPVTVRLLSTVERSTLLVTVWPHAIGMQEPERQHVRASRPLRRGQRLEWLVNLEIGNAPKQTFAIEIDALDKQGNIVETQAVELYFHVRDGRFTRASYEGLYVPTKRKGRVAELNGSAYELRTTAGVPRYLEKQPSKRALTFGEAVTLGTVADLKPILARFETGRATAANVSKALSGDRLAADKAEQRLSILDEFAGGERPVSFLSGSGQSFNTTGKFGYIGRDRIWHPGWNWQVKLSWLDSEGDSHDLGGAYIESDGSWKISFAALGYTGQNLFVQYGPTSRFAGAVDQDDEPYWWHSYRRYTVATNYDFGLETADTSASGDLSGIGDVYQAAMDFWWGFYSAGVNPKRRESIKLYFPNTWEFCGTKPPNKRLWSCASPAGEIWLIPAHASSFTVQHELGHQLNFEFWGDSWPGQSGDHDLVKCFQPGLALVEGFADAVPYWLNNTINTATPMVQRGPNDLESPSAIHCAGDWNEWWVAATFWDLIDSDNDGLDRVNLSPSVMPFMVYLWAGPKTSLRFYLADHMAFTPPQPIDWTIDVYKNNKIPLN